MSSILPIIKVDRPNRVILMEALYDLGLRFSDCETAETALRWMSSSNGYLWLDDLDRIDGSGVGFRLSKDQLRKTLMNSTAQFVSYVRRLRAARHGGA